MEGIPAAVLKQGQQSESFQKELAEGKPLDLNNTGEEAIPPESEKPPEIPEQEPGQDQGALKEQENNRYKVLQGMFDKYKQETSEQIAQLQNTIRQQEDTIANLNAIISKGTEQQPGGDKQGEGQSPKRLKPENYSDYGEEIEDMAKMVNDLMDENDRLKSSTEQFGQTIKATEEERINSSIHSFENAMAEKVGKDWQKINVDPLFINWLNDNPSFRTALDAAGQNLSANDAARIFNLFIKETGYVVAGQGSGYDINDEVIPSAGAGSDAPLDQGGFTPVTRAQFDKASKARALGQMDEKTFNRISMNFQRTIKEGKVR